MVGVLVPASKRHSVIPIAHLIVNSRSSSTKKARDRSVAASVPKPCSACDGSSTHRSDDNFTVVGWALSNRSPATSKTRACDDSLFVVRRR